MIRLGVSKKKKIIKRSVIHICISPFRPKTLVSIKKSFQVHVLNVFTFILSAETTAAMRITMIGFLVLVMGAAVKAHVHFIRLALLAAMGLAGMWMMHKLAQDWQKISSRPKPAAMAGKLLGLWKRSIDEAVSKFVFLFFFSGSRRPHVFG